MSDNIIKIISKRHLDELPFSEEYVISEVKKLLPNADVDCEKYNNVQFIDCGSNLESIHCPICGSNIDFDVWGEYMEAASENDFIKLDTVMECCGRNVSLNELDYYFECGFAKFEIDIINPPMLPDDFLHRLSEKLNINLRMINSHI